jgi:hypothetical protein
MELNEFQSLEDRWNITLKDSPSKTIFSTWEWLSTWWKHFGEGKKLVILLIENKNRFAIINRKNVEISIIRKGLFLHLRTYDWLMKKRLF